MIVKCVDHSISEPYDDFIFEKEYQVVEILDTKYCIIDEVNDRHYVNKNNFKVITK